MRKAALDTVASLVERDSRVVFVGSDLGAGTLGETRARHPERVLIEGIAEQHLVSFAAGLALEGFIPYVHTIATFLTRRALEQVIVDVAFDQLPVILLGAGGGMVYAPLGPTHQAIDDFALMSAVPGIKVVAPADPLEMQSVLELLLREKSPAYVRVAKGGEPIISESLAPLEVGKMRLARKGESIALLTTGALLHECIKAAEELAGEGVKPTVAHFPFIAPIDGESIAALAANHKRLLVVEEHIPKGGLSSAVADILSEIDSSPLLHRQTLPHSYAERYGSQAEHWQMLGLNSRGISRRVLEILG